MALRDGIFGLCGLVLLTAPLLSGCQSLPGLGSGDLVERADDEGEFRTFVAAVDAAELRAALAEPGPYTVFAPTDEAFRAVPEETMGELLEPENKARLQEVLLYHVVEGEGTAESLIGRRLAADTLGGGNVVIEGTPEGTVTVNGASVTVADRFARNGVLHGIDRVLLPENAPAIPQAAPSEEDAMPDETAPDADEAAS